MVQQFRQAHADLCGAARTIISATVTAPIWTSGRTEHLYIWEADSPQQLPGVRRRVGSHGVHRLVDHRERDERRHRFSPCRVQMVKVASVPGCRRPVGALTRTSSCRSVRGTNSRGVLACQVSAPNTATAPKRTPLERSGVTGQSRVMLGPVTSSNWGVTWPSTSARSRMGVPRGRSVVRVRCAVSPTA